MLFLTLNKVKTEKTRIIHISQSVTRWNKQQYISVFKRIQIKTFKKISLTKYFTNLHYAGKMHNDIKM